MKLKVGREYKDNNDNVYKILYFDGTDVVWKEECGIYREEFLVEDWKDDELLPPSIEYLQNINQPFGTLDEDVQDAFDKFARKGVVQKYYGDEWEGCCECDDNDLTYRLSPDYVETKEEKPKKIEYMYTQDDSTHEKAYARDYQSKLNEVIDAINEIREKL